MVMTDYYSLLQINKDATTEEIKKAFMKQALVWHPDKAESDEDREKFQKVYEDLQKAYQILSNEETRKMYADTQQNTFIDFRRMERDVGYGVSDKFSKVTSEGLKFDIDSFTDAFNQSRSKEERDAFNNLHANVGTETITEDDFQKLLAERENARSSLDSEISQVFQGVGEGFDRDTFNRAFDFMKKNNPNTGLDEYHGEPQSMFSTGGLVEDDGMSGLAMSNGINMLNHMDMDNLVSGTSYNPNAEFDIAQFQTGEAYGQQEALSNTEMAERIEAINQDRLRLADPTRIEFKNEPSEIETLYKDLYREHPIVAEQEGLEPPKPCQIVTAELPEEEAKTESKVRRKINTLKNR